MISDPLPIGEPPSLRRHCLRHLELIDSAGRCITVGRKALLLRSGQRLRIRVVLANQLNATPDVDIHPDDTLQVIQEPSSFPERATLVVQAEYRAMVKSSLPEQISKWLPFITASGELVIVVKDGQWAPVSVTLPVRVRPEFWGMLRRMATVMGCLYLSHALYPAIAAGKFTSILETLVRPEVWVNTFAAMAVGGVGATIALGVTLAWGE